MLLFYHALSIIVVSRVFFSRVFKASNLSRNFNRPSLFELEEKKQKELSRGNFSQKQQKKTELKNIFDYNFANVIIYARTEDTRATHTRVVVVSV
jgi:hypothetical protein